MLGCDCVKSDEEVRRVAKFVVHSLDSDRYGDRDRDSSRKDNTSASLGSFLHIGPHYREGNNELERILGRGYRMNSNLEDIVLERLDLDPQVVKVEAEKLGDGVTLEGLEAHVRDNIQMESERNTVKYEHRNSRRYSALSVSHYEHFYGFLGNHKWENHEGLSNMLQNKWNKSNNIERAGRAILNEDCKRNVQTKRIVTSNHKEELEEEKDLPVNRSHDKRIIGNCLVRSQIQSTQADSNHFYELT